MQHSYPMHYSETNIETAAEEIARMAEQIRPRPIPPNIGTFAACRFCGQFVNVLESDIKTLENVEDAVEYATMRCDCTPARRYADDVMRKRRMEQERQFTLMEAEDAIDEQFGAIRGGVHKVNCPEGAREDTLGCPVSEQVRKMLNDAAALVYDHKMKGMTLSISSRVKAVITRNSKGFLLAVTAFHLAPKGALCVAVPCTARISQRLLIERRDNAASRVEVG